MCVYLFRWNSNEYHSLPLRAPVGQHRHRCSVNTHTIHSHNSSLSGHPVDSAERNVVPSVRDEVCSDAHPFRLNRAPSSSLRTVFGRCVLLVTCVREFPCVPCAIKYVRAASRVWVSACVRAGVYVRVRVCVCVHFLRIFVYVSGRLVVNIYGLNTSGPVRENAPRSLTEPPKSCRP